MIDHAEALRAQTGKKQPMSSSPQPWADYGSVFYREWEKLKDIPGNVAEFGCYQGGTTLQLRAITQREVYAFDTFEGIPKEDYSPGLDSHDKPGKFHPGLPWRTLFTDPHIHPIPGRFAKTLSRDVLLSLVLAYVDCDLYLSCKQVLDWIPPQLVDGAVIVFDDYTTHEGIRRAVDEFRLVNRKNVRGFKKVQYSGVRLEWSQTKDEKR
jgi:hypothetical protein